MNRLVMIVLKNLYRAPFVAGSLWHCAAHPEKYTQEQRYRRVQEIGKIVQDYGKVEIQVYGRENIPQNDGFIFYPNHQGVFDGVAMVEACPKPFSPVIKKELMEVPFVKQIFQCLDSFPMDREDTRQSVKVMQEVQKRVNEKKNCLIFAEGTRSRQGNRLLEFKGGSFKAAFRTKCPVVPVALIDSYKPFDQKGTAPRNDSGTYIKAYSQRGI